MSGSNCCFLTCKQVSQEVREIIWYSHLFKNFPQFVVIHRVKGFSVVMKQGRHFSGSLLFFLWATDISNLIPNSSAFSKSSLYIWKVSVHVLLKPSLKDLEHYLLSLWIESDCVILWTFFGIALLWDWNENWLFPVLWPLLSFPNFLAYWAQHFNSIIF